MQDKLTEAVLDIMNAVKLYVGPNPESPLYPIDINPPGLNLSPKRLKRLKQSIDLVFSVPIDHIRVASIPHFKDPNNVLHWIMWVAHAANATPGLPPISLITDKGEYVIGGNQAQAQTADIQESIQIRQHPSDGHWMVTKLSRRANF